VSTPNTAWVNAAGLGPSRVADNTTVSSSLSTSMLAWASNWVLTGWVWAQSGRATAQAKAKTNRFMGWLLEGDEGRSKALLLILYGYF
jgi:hypothetical protein